MAIAKLTPYYQLLHIDYQIYLQKSTPRTNIFYAFAQLSAMVCSTRHRKHRYGPELTFATVLCILLIDASDETPRDESLATGYTSSKDESTGAVPPVASGVFESARSDSGVAMLPLLLEK